MNQLEELLMNFSNRNLIKLKSEQAFWEEQRDFENEK
jgi:hypothetical protein